VCGHVPLGYSFTFAGQKERSTVPVKRYGIVIESNCVMELPAFVHFVISLYSEERAEPSMVFCNCSAESSMCRLHMILLSLLPTVQLSEEAKEA